MTYSYKYKSYIVDIPSYSLNEQTFYKFDNGFGASVVLGPYSYDLEVAVIEWDGLNWNFAYYTPLTNDVIGWVDDLDEILGGIKLLPALNSDLVKQWQREYNLSHDYYTDMEEI